MECDRCQRQRVKSLRDRILIYLNGLTRICLLQRTGNNKDILFFSQTPANSGVCDKSYSGISALSHLFSLAESLPAGTLTQEKVADLSLDQGWG